MDSTHLLMLPFDPLTWIIPPRQALRTAERVGYSSGKSIATASGSVIGWLSAGKVACATIPNILQRSGEDSLSHDSVLHSLRLIALTT